MRFIFILCGILGLAAVSFAVDISGCMNISASGEYVLTTDLVGANQNVSVFPLDDEFACIRITTGATGISLDCNGYSMTNDAAHATAYGIYLDPQIDNITVRNCRIVNYTGGVRSFYGNSSQPPSLENSMFINNTINGSPDGIGFEIWNATNVSFVGNAISGVDSGIITYDTNWNSYVNNTVYNARTGIYLTSGIGNLIWGNNVDLAGHYGGCIGIRLLKFSNISGNTAANCFGVGAVDSASDVFADNFVHDVHFTGFAMSNFDNGTFMYNRVENVEPTGDTSYGAFVLRDGMSTVSNVLFYGNNVTNAWIGFSLGGANISNIDIINNTILNSTYSGIFLKDNYNISIINNTIQESAYAEIDLAPTDPADVSLCSEYNISNNTGSGGRQIRYVANQPAILSNAVFSELFLCNADNSRLQNVTIRGSDSLQNDYLWMYFVDNATITLMNSSGNAYGIIGKYDSNISVRNSDFSDNLDAGVWIGPWFAAPNSNITIANCTFDRDSMAIYMGASDSVIANSTFSQSGGTAMTGDNNRILNNVVSGGGGGSDAFHIGPSDNFTVSGNRVSGYNGSLYWFEGVSNSVFTNNTGETTQDFTTPYLDGVYIDRGNNVLIANSTLGLASDGIRLQMSSGINVTNVTVHDVLYGIYLHQTTSSYISGNSIYNNALYRGLAGSVGIELLGFYASGGGGDKGKPPVPPIYRPVAYNYIYNNNITNFSMAAYFNYAEYNEFHDNYLYGNEYGMYAENPDGNHPVDFNSIYRNKIFNNSFEGVYLAFSDSNNFSNNTIYSNGDYGFYSDPSSSNLYNNIICLNTAGDLYSADWASSYGENNSCDNPDGWNDYGFTGCANVCPNLIPPAVILLEPPNGSSWGLNHSTNFTFNASDDTSPQLICTLRVTDPVFGELNFSIMALNGEQTLVQVLGLTSGIHSWVVRCIDLDDNAAESPTAQFMITEVCGDAACSASENCSTCEADCGACPAVCGNGICEDAESCSSCRADCGPCSYGGGTAVTGAPYCGDYICGSGETCSSCPSDCGACVVSCGDGVCNGNETCTSCSSDCGSCGPVCGDAVCNGNESCSTCPGDCGSCGPVCGDAVCNGNESCSSCPSDCGVCPTAYCGDNVCNGGETCTSCARDCGSCQDCSRNGACNSNCASDPDCCVSDSDCPDGEVCSAGTCVISEEKTGCAYSNPPCSDCFACTNNACVKLDLTVGLVAPLEAQLGSVVKVTLLSQDGMPLPGAYVIVTDPAGSSVKYTTDAAGALTYTADKIGVYSYSVPCAQIQVTSLVFTSIYDAAAEPSSKVLIIPLDLRDPSHMKMEVFASGEATRASVQTRDPLNHASLGSTSGAGRYDRDLLLRGRYVFTISASDVKSLSAKIELTPLPSVTAYTAESWIAIIVLILLLIGAGYLVRKKLKSIMARTGSS